MARRIVSIEARGPEVPVHDDPLDVLERGSAPRFATVGPVTELRADGRTRKLAAGEVRLPRRLSHRKVRTADAGRWLRQERPGAAMLLPRAKAFADFFWEMFLPRLGLGFSKELQRRGQPRPPRGVVVRGGPYPQLNWMSNAVFWSFANGLQHDAQHNDGGRCACGVRDLLPPLLGLQLALDSLDMLDAPPARPRFDPCAQARMMRPDHHVQALTAPATVELPAAASSVQLFADGAGELRLGPAHINTTVNIVRTSDGPPIVVRGDDLAVELHPGHTVELAFDGGWAVRSWWRHS